MNRYRRHLLDTIASWDTPTRLSLTVAVVLLAVMFGLFAFGGEPLQVPALVGITTLLLVIQAVVLWGNRHMVTPFTQAQGHYRRAEFQQVVQLLAPRAEAANVDVRELTLLGNTYRQLGDLSKSETVLFKAVNISPQSYFPLYGFGRTLLVQGDYDRAAHYLSQALDHDAPVAVRVDLAEALHRLGQPDAAAAQLAQVSVKLEAHRAVMRAYLTGQPINPADVAHGLPYWQETAKRFQHTPYGVALQQDVVQIEAITQGEN